VLVNIKLLLFDAAAPTAMAAALTRKMAERRSRGKCRLSLVSIAAGYGARVAPASLYRHVLGRLNADKWFVTSAASTERSRGYRRRTA
jgi:hypothetical protein